MVEVRRLSLSRNLDEMICETADTRPDWFRLKKHTYFIDKLVLPFENPSLVIHHKAPTVLTGSWETV